MPDSTNPVAGTPTITMPTQQQQQQQQGVPGQGFQWPRPQRDPNSTIDREKAILTVHGIDYWDWESIWVELDLEQAYSFFRFTSVERQENIFDPGQPLGNIFPKLQIMPGVTSDCAINLGGSYVLTGLVETRQVAYDAHRHGIEISGKSYSAVPFRSSVNTDSGSFDGMSFEAVARKVLSPYPNGVITIGKLDATPFDKLQNQPGEHIWDFLERIARPRKIILGSDSFGNVLLIGDHDAPVLNTQLIEGQNIKKMQCIFKKDLTAALYRVIGQAPASDDNAGTQASEMHAQVGGSGASPSIFITPAEQPVKNIAELQRRAVAEWTWSERSLQEATVTVQGWYRDDVHIWWPGEKVYVYSPMCPLTQICKIQRVIFSQDSQNGTETTLGLLPPFGGNDIGVDASPTAINLSPEAQAEAARLIAQSGTP